MFGAQYLHTEVPGLTDGQKPFLVEYRLEGELEEYLHKVYGAEIPDPGKITRAGLVGTYPAWDIRAAYYRAWERYGPEVLNLAIDADEMNRIIGSGIYDWIISTVPANSVCEKPGEHAFAVRDVWAVGDAPERGVFSPQYVREPNVILYDGTPHRGWYRASNIAGYQAVEWPEGNKPPIEDVARVQKPIGTNCDCWLAMRNARTRVVRMGRYGAWDRKGHTHQAYWSTLKVLGGKS